MNEPVIDIRDRIEKMRNQMSPQSIQKKDNIKSNSPENSEYRDRWHNYK